ncbi:hypothetical protein [Robinsoniella peoriensis]
MAGMNFQTRCSASIQTPSVTNVLSPQAEWSVRSDNKTIPDLPSLSDY